MDIKQFKILDIIFKQWFYLSLTFILLIISQNLFATHLRAGEITATRTGPLTYCFTIYLYTDDTPGTADSPDLDLNFGDGTPIVNVPRLPGAQGRIQLPNETKLNIYTVCHTFPSAGPYLISFTEPNRNADVQNMSNSVFTPFSVSTFILIDPNLGLNSTPSFRVAPLDIACPGQRFVHNPGAFDIDGDSLSFKLTTPRQSNTQNVNGYLDPTALGSNPTNEANTGPAGFSLDPITGDLVWDAPLVPGEYNIAFLVEEWRNGVRIGFVVRDMQILVEDRCTNKRPDLTVPDICVVADEDPNTTSNIINQIITATDPDINPKDNIIISSQSSSGLQQGVYDTNIFNIVANFIFTPPQTSTATATFKWDTRVEHVRREPYIVVFKAEDQPVPPRGPKLVDIESMLITVKGPQPLNLSAIPDARAMNLSWDNYLSRLPNNYNTTGMKVIIWRREGCLQSIPCDKNPDEVGYIKIGETAINATSFRDNGPLRPGLSYSYVITTVFPEPKGGVSQASQEVCVFIPIDSPLITKVSVDITNEIAINNGQITINWLRPRPLEGDISASFPIPYKYELYRANGLSGTGYTLINTQNDATGDIINFNFTDTGLNTEANPYHYKVEWFTSAGTINEARRIPSDSASSVRLTATPGNNIIVLTWEYNVPWTNQNQIHQIFRGLPGQAKNTFVKIGEVLVGQRRFVDDGSVGGCLDPDETYCYYITTKGTYGNPTIPEPIEGLLNDSQIDCASPDDNIPPPAPVLSLLPIDCSIFSETTPIENKLSWIMENTGDPCQDEIAGYRLYYRPTSEGDFTLLPNPPFTQPYLATTFTHKAPFLPVINGITSQAGCYVVTALDASGNESAFSNIVCQDNCFAFTLPNVFTPTGDGFNELFKPDSIRFVESVRFTVFNRWGGKLKEITNDIEINWDGKNEQGQEMPTGVYYYEAEVKFITLNPVDAVQKFKGWIQLIRKEFKE